MDLVRSGRTATGGGGGSSSCSSVASVSGVVEGELEGWLPEVGV